MEHLKKNPTSDEIILNIMPLLKNGITPGLGIGRTKPEVGDDVSPIDLDGEPLEARRGPNRLVMILHTQVIPLTIRKFCT